MSIIYVRREELSDFSKGAVVASALALSVFPAPSMARVDTTSAGVKTIIAGADANRVYVKYCFTSGSALASSTIPENFRTFSSTDENSNGIAKTELGRLLLECRAKAIANGMKLLSLEEIDSEMRSLRGEDS